MDWKRINSVVVALVMVGAFTSSSDVFAQEDKKAKAEALNDEGKVLIGELDLEGAADRFRKAVALVEDPRYAFNLCFALEKSGGLDEAKRSCKWVTGSTDERLAKKAAVLLKKVEAKLAKRKPKPLPPRQPPPRQPPPRQPPPGQPGPHQSPPPNGGMPSGGFPPPGVRVQPPVPPPMTVMPDAETPANRFGVRVGITNSFVEGLPGGTNLIGAAISGMYGFSMHKPLQFIAELQYANRGTDVTFTSDFFDDTATLELNYIDFTGTSRYTFGSSRTKAYLEFGLTLSILADTASDAPGFGDVEAEVSPVDVSSNVGVGVMFKSLDLRLKYMYGLLDIAGADAMVQDAIHSRSTLFELGYWF